MFNQLDERLGTRGLLILSLLVSIVYVSVHIGSKGEACVGCSSSAAGVELTK